MSGEEVPSIVYVIDVPCSDSLLSVNVSIVFCTSSFVLSNVPNLMDPANDPSY